MECSTVLDLKEIKNFEIMLSKPSFDQVSLRMMVKPDLSLIMANQKSLCRNRGRTLDRVVKNPHYEKLLSIVTTQTNSIRQPFCGSMLGLALRLH